MSSKPETTFTQSVHRHMPHEFHRDKMNNPYTGGIPDVWYSGTRSDLWVEYKFEILPKRGDTMVPIGLSQLQTDWLNKRYREGRNVAVIVGCKEGGVIFTQGAWNTPLTMNAFTGKLMSRAELAGWIIERTGGPFGT